MRFLYKLILLLIFPLLIVSCGTRQQRAERLIKRANKLYPIDSLVSEKLTIDTLIKYDTTIVVKSDTALISIPATNPITHEKIVYKKNVVFENDRARVTATTNSDGGIDLDILFKQQKIEVKGTVRYNKEIITHRKLITVHEKVRGFFWWVGLSICILLFAGSIFAIIKFIKPKLI